jgi:hypothetical protein
MVLCGCFQRDQGNDNAAGKFPQLELVAALPVDVPLPLEPSGLTEWNGILYTVADKADDTIFQLVPGEESVELAPAIRFIPPEPGEMDWEGICVDSGGSFYLISENHGRVLRVTTDGTATWATDDLRDKASGPGLFAKSNAGFEGIAWLGPNKWLGAVEREPRGLVEWSGFGGSTKVVATRLDHSPYSSALPLIRLPDFSGLDADGGRVYALFRAAHLVVRLDRVDGTLTEAAAWSYAHIETDPRWAFRSQTYGQAEGLVVNGRDVYLIFDNNLGGRQADPNDGRPLFVHARFPEAP